MPYKLTNENHRPQGSSLPFKKMGKIEYEDFSDIFDFTYNMVFGEGHHRNVRSGGDLKRSPMLKFKDVFEGKVGEFGIYRTFLKHGIDIGKPDLSIASRGVWDSGDFRYKDINFSVKSSKHFSQMMLLESKDYYVSNNKVIYRPDKHEYDIFLLSRVKTNIFDNANFDNIQREKSEALKKVLFGNSYILFDIPGYISNKDLFNFISNGFQIKKGDKLNGRTVMDADNYYVFAKDMKPVTNLINILKKI